MLPKPTLPFLIVALLLVGAGCATETPKRYDCWSVKHLEPLDENDNRCTVLIDCNYSPVGISCVPQ